MRDIYDLDMMPFYNCFGNEYLADIDFDSSGKVFSTKFSDSMYKILSVPVRFGQTYMIALNSEVPVECICAIYGSKGYIKALTDNLNSINSEPATTSKHNTYQKFQRTQFQSPVLYKTVSWHQLYAQLEDDDTKTINEKAYDQSLGQFEKYLRLLIKIPKTNNSSVVVIEGNYSVQDQKNLINVIGSEHLQEYKAKSNITWSNQYLYGTSVNAKTVSGDWIRPEIIQNADGLNFVKNNNQIEFNNKKNTYNYSFTVIYKQSETSIVTLLNQKITQVFENSINNSDREDAVKQIIKNRYASVLNTSVENLQITDLSEAVIVNPEYKKYEKPLLSPLGLLQVSDGNIYAFSDRLVEYLVQNVINHLDEFTKDIERVQQYSKSDINYIKNIDRYTGDIVPGVWDKDFQTYLFNLVEQSKILGRKIDLTGYVDKDTETIITRGQKV